ncbi:unnamed protein product, partial [Prorocentrum cordatum]
MSHAESRECCQLPGGPRGEGGRRGAEVCQDGVWALVEGTRKGTNTNHAVWVDSTPRPPAMGPRAPLLAAAAGLSHLGAALQLHEEEVLSRRCDVAAKEDAAGLIRDAQWDRLRGHPCVHRIGLGPRWRRAARLLAAARRRARGLGAALEAYRELSAAAGAAADPLETFRGTLDPGRLLEELRARHPVFLLTKANCRFCRRANSCSRSWAPASRRCSWTASSPVRRRSCRSTCGRQLELAPCPACTFRGCASAASTRPTEALERRPPPSARARWCRGGGHLAGWQHVRFR